MTQTIEGGPGLDTSDVTALPVTQTIERGPGLGWRGCGAVTQCQISGGGSFITTPTAGRAEITFAVCLEGTFLYYVVPGPDLENKIR